MFLRLWANSAVIDNGSAGNRVLTVIDQHGRIHKVPVGVLMPNPDLGNLAGPTGHGILMTIDARGRVEYRAQAGMDVFSFFKGLLIEGKSVIGWFGYSLTNALSGRESWSIKTCRCFGCRLLRDSGNSDCQKHKQAQEKVRHFVSHGKNLP